MRLLQRRHELCTRESAKNSGVCCAGGSLGGIGLTLQRSAFLDCDADSGLVNLQGRLLDGARRVRDPHMRKEAASRRRRGVVRFPSQVPLFPLEYRIMTTHSTEAQASEDGSERPDVGHVGDEDLCRKSTVNAFRVPGLATLCTCSCIGGIACSEPAIGSNAGCLGVVRRQRERDSGSQLLTLTADCAAGLVSSYRRYNALDSDH